MNNENLVIVFTKNPILGKCKTRLAKSIGQKKALYVYKDLLEHTRNTLSKTPYQVAVFYSEYVDWDDAWNKQYQKKTQAKGHLGKKMKKAFEWAFEQDYKKVVLIGTDLLDLETTDLKKGFELLTTNELVIGPADDGGYYLIGMKRLINEAFTLKKWSTDSVLTNTLEDCEAYQVKLLDYKNDIDNLEDLEKSTYDLKKIGF